MSEKTHEALVGGQFGSRAEAYLNSAVHAQSPDLDALVTLMKDWPEVRVLDLGCGGGHVTFNVAPLVRRVVAYDLAPEMLALVARAATERGLDNVTTQQGAVESLPFEDGSFDVVLSRFSAHHWRDLDAGLREAARVVKAGGMVAMVDTVSSGIPLTDTYFQAIELLRDCSHVRNYSRAESALRDRGRWQLSHRRGAFHGIKGASMKLPPATHQRAQVRMTETASQTDVDARHKAGHDAAVTCPAPAARSRSRSSRS